MTFICLILMHKLGRSSNYKMNKINDSNDFCQNSKLPVNNFLFLGLPSYSLFTDLFCTYWIFLKLTINLELVWVVNICFPCD